MTADGYHTVIGVKVFGGLIGIGLCYVLGGCGEMMGLVLIVNAVAAGDGIADKFDNSALALRRLYALLGLHGHGFYGAGGVCGF